jgi:NADH-ubiquinone oxidoreductase chain 4
MLLITLIVTPLLGMISILLLNPTDESPNKNLIKLVALTVSLINLIISLIVWILFNSSSIYFQFIQEHYNIGYYDFYLGIDGLSIYFVLLTTIIMPLSIISNWKSINKKIVYFLSIMLLLESLLLLIYMVLDLLMFYIFFESILAPLFLLIGIFGSIERERASFYFFLYTFLGSLFMLLSIITVSYLSGCTDISIVSRNGFIYATQLLIFFGIFIAFAVKTPVIYLNGWLLKAHVESPLSGSIILAAIVLKLSLYGIFRLILIISPKAYMASIYIIFTIGVITIVYASLSTLRTIDIKELIAYSSVSHAAVYFIGVFSNVIQGIIGGICLGLAHGFVSSGLFTIAGGVLYDRSSTRIINHYRGLVQAMPILSILFFILCLGNCGAPLTFNFIGEFMSLYGVFERLPLAGILSSSSIVFSAAFTIYMFNRIIFGGSLFKMNWIEYIMDLNIREYSILLVLVIFTVSLGIYPSIVTDGLNYVTQGLLYTYNTITDSIESITYNDDSEVNPNSDISRLLNTPELSPTPEPMQVPRNTPVNVIPRNFTFEYVDFRNESNEITSLTSNISQPDTSTTYAPISGNIQFK